MKRELTCIVCPKGCCMSAVIDGGKVVNIEGNGCPRGRAYAEAECIAPMRTITTTVKCLSGEILPVKTDSPIPKGKIFEAMRIISRIYPVLPINAGDVIIKNVFGSNVIATRNIG